MNELQKQHEMVIRAFIEYLNTNDDSFILKGGTALFLCYHLDRFSEDIDLDGSVNKLIPLVEAFCLQNNYW